MDSNKSQTILLVDDDTNLLESMRRLLHGDGHRIRCAHGPDEALRLLRADEVDLIISDQVMSGMSGIEFLKQVQHLHPDVSRILMTGYATIEMISEAINKGGIERIFIKPCPSEDIVSGVRQVLIRRQLIESALRVLDNHEHGVPIDHHPESFLSSIMKDRDGAIVMQEVPYGYRTLVRRLKRTKDAESGPPDSLPPSMADDYLKGDL